VKKCWAVECFFNVKRLRLAIMARCWMLMSAQSWKPLLLSADGHDPIDAGDF
jgi:hypothetical protein